MAFSQFDFSFVFFLSRSLSHKVIDRFLMWEKSPFVGAQAKKNNHYVFSLSNPILKKSNGNTKGRRIKRFSCDTLPRLMHEVREYTGNIQRCIIMNFTVNTSPYMPQFITRGLPKHLP